MMDEMDDEEQFSEESGLDLSYPYCGESVEVEIDESGGGRQAYVEDCPVCCRPMQVTVTHDRNGDWSVNLRTSDE